MSHTTKEQRREALETAITRAGGIIAFSKAMGVTHQAVTSWRQKAYVPLQRAVSIEAIFGVERTSLIDPQVASLLIAPSAPAADLL